MIDTPEIHTVLKLLKKQVRELDVPWLENMAKTSTHKDPFRVLISCLLSLRTQDKTTGTASERLFAIAPDVYTMSNLPVKKIESAIYPVGFYRTKARRVKELCRYLINNYDGRVPDSMDDLLKIKGVGRKTANLVITLGYKKLGICVDTHVHRITNRWGYVKTNHPEQTELALREKLPKRYWIEINGLLVAFGQGICKPISPLCTSCYLTRFCKKAGVKRHR
jgi:endonuclease-3